MRQEFVIDVLKLILLIGLLLMEVYIQWLKKQQNFPGNPVSMKKH